MKAGSSEATTAGRPAPALLDPWLLGSALALTALGLVMVYSSSAIAAQERLGDGAYYLKRQGAAAGVGLVGLVVALKIGYWRLARFAYPLLIFSAVAQILVLIPGLGHAAGGATRWIRIGGFSLQPAEMVKLSWLIYLAYSLAKKGPKAATFSIGLLPHLIIGSVLSILCLAQPDFGSGVALFFLLAVLVFAAGARISHLLGVALASTPLLALLIVLEPYRVKRIVAFLRPWENRHDAGYQVTESLISIGSGGLTGLGLGEGRQKLYFLPEAHTDFIFSIIGEELGLLGVAAVVAVYAVYIWRGIRIASRATEAFGAYLALGISSLVGFHAVVNMFVAMSLLPTKGLTLPFISYGGSSLVILLSATGLLLSVGVSAREPEGSRTPPAFRYHPGRPDPAGTRRSRPRRAEVTT